MANSHEVLVTLDMATDHGDLKDAIVVGRGHDNKVQFFTAEADRDRMVALLERAKNILMQSLEGGN